MSSVVGRFFAVSGKLVALSAEAIGEPRSIEVVDVGRSAGNRLRCRRPPNGNLLQEWLRP